MCYFFINFEVAYLSKHSISFDVAQKTKGKSIIKALL